MSHGYSGTPLVKKLGIKENYRIRIIHGPEGYFDLLGDIPDNVQFLSRKSKNVDFIHLFAKDKATFEKQIIKIKEEIKKDGIIWVSWYKKASKIPTDLSEAIVRNTILTMGLVDIKKCAVDSNWSGLKVVWRKENR